MDALNEFVTGSGGGERRAAPTIFTAFFLSLSVPLLVAGCTAKLLCAVCENLTSCKALAACGSREDLKSVCGPPYGEWRFIAANSDGEAGDYDHRWCRGEDEGEDRE